MQISEDEGVLRLVDAEPTCSSTIHRTQQPLLNAFTWPCTVGGFLVLLGLQRWISLFELEELTLISLASLNEADLNEICPAMSIGERKKLLHFCRVLEEGSRGRGGLH